MKKIVRDLIVQKTNEDEEHSAHITNPIHGGKVTCHKCGGFLCENDSLFIMKVYFHEDCFNRYEHYYGLDRPID